ncbi:MAG: hypothetical protein JNL82_16120 [Myxococcales bacterium]|nr:hypothetical protein [Myxococcales bacterium]
MTTAAAALEKLLPRWRAKLPAHYSPAYIDGFIARNRSALAEIVARAMMLRRVKRGTPPKTPDEFAAYGKLAERERTRDAEPDDVVMARIAARLGRMKPRGRIAPELAARRYVEARAVAVLLRRAGLDAVPLLLREPATAILVDGRVVAVVDEVEREVAVVPGYADEDTLRMTLSKSYQPLAAMIRDIPEARLERYAAVLWARVRGPSVTPAAPPVETAPDLQAKPWRTEANLKAMQLVMSKAPGEFTAEDLAALAQYSGWGGLSIEGVKKRFPEGLVPETFGLIHEYYTPTMIARAIAAAICSMLPELAGNDGVVRALEPSAGIGRLIRAFDPQLCLALEAGGQVKKIEWTAIEFSKVSSKLLRALRPDIDLHHMSFEQWVHEEGARHRGTLGLVVSNPPYGERGVMAREDPDDFYKEKRAYAYFMRRTLDLLVPGGVGVFLVPAGFLSGNLNRGLREKLLLRHHLLAAFRLPSHDAKGRETVPGASVVMDMVFWRSRGGELTEVDEADQFIVDGDYFTREKDHILGKEDGPFAGDDEAGLARSWRYRVTGEFRGLPPLVPRPLCTACTLGTIAVREQVGPVRRVTQESDDIPADIDEALRPALELGRRVGRYLAIVAADEADRAAQLWPELRTALLDFHTAAGNPWRNRALLELAQGPRQLPAAQHLFTAFEKSGGLTLALREAPRITPKFTGPPDDIVAQAEALFRQQRVLKVPQLLAFHRQQGGTLGDAAAVAAVLAAEWNLDGDAWDELLPPDAYLTGTDLWARHDRAAARAATGDEQAKLQVRRLLEAIRPATFEDLPEVSPRHGYVPLELVAGWVSDTINGRYGPVNLERRGGFVQLQGHDYTDPDQPPIAPETLIFLGYVNHDPELFRPEREPSDRSAGPKSREEKAAKKQNLAERRLALAKKWDESFRSWVAADEVRREQLVHAYNRVARGRIVPTYSPEPLEIARWGPQSPKLKPHQIAGARRVLAQRGGLVAFDVGVGKTYTALAIVARARQEGWVRRPVILVPGSLVWKWHDDILCTLPDYRVAVIGSKRKQITRGVRSGVITSETDTPEERAKKWTLLMSGQVDVVILSYDALARTKMKEEAVLAYVSQVEAVERSIALRRRALEEKVNSARQKNALSERDRALLEHGVHVWVEEILELPKDWEYDPGVAWDDIGIDMLVVDEAAAFKNLHKPQAREDGVPKFMGGGGEGSDRAWQLDFRAAAVRRKTGGAGIVLLTATPAKNSPLEFYNLIQYIDPTAFTKAGIRDPEQFIDRFLRMEYREVLDSSFNIAKKMAVTGFMALDDLRTIILTYSEFRTAAEVGLKLPRPVVEMLKIKMDDDQEAKYDKYVAQIEDILEHPNPEGGQSFVILGLLARLSLVALHAALEDGYTYKTALEGGVVKKKVWQDGEQVEVSVRLPRPTHASPKLTECAKRVAASPHCGHIIFCEPTAVHQWMREVLVQHGIPRERIAILNAEETAPADRIRIAREFNGLSSETPPPGTCARPQDTTVTPKYDVVIANSVAYEGVDLQVRTCTIHHLDLPWTPADLEQRNGRAVRQGNTLGTVQVFYYFADRSTDGYRFSLIDGKAGWLGQLIKSQVRDTNNPAAQQQLTPEDILLMISRNKEKTKRLLEEKRQRQAEEARARIAREAARVLRQAAGRFRDARASADLERAARLRDEGDQRLEDLEQVSADAWPWAPWMYAARDTDMIVPESGGAPVYEGLRLARPRPGAPGQLDYFEFGRIVQTDEGERIGLRAAGSPGWQLVTYTGLLGGAPITAAELPRDGGPAWPEDDDARTAAALERSIAGSLRHGRFESLAWLGASDAWLAKWWPRFADQITEALASSYHREKVPVTDEEGLAVASGPEVRGATILPPTLAGWQRYLELAPKSGESFTTLKDVGLAWWGRKIPSDLLSKAKETDDEEAERIEGEGTTPVLCERCGHLADRAERHNAVAGVECPAGTTEFRKATPEEIKKYGQREPGPPRPGTWRHKQQERQKKADERAARKLAEEAERQRKRAERESRRGATTRSSLPAERREEAAEQIGELVLPPHRRSAYLARVEKAAARGESPKRIVSEAAQESKEFVQERAANRSRELAWDESVTHAFEQEPGWRLDIVKRGAGHRLSVYPEGGALADAVLAIDVHENDILDVHWSTGALTTAQQSELLRRVQRALQVANAVQAGSLPPSPLQGRIEEVRRRAAELGIDPAVLAGQASHGAMARALAHLADPRPEATGDLIGWLRANHGDHPALSVIKEWRDGDAPGDSSLAGELWSAVFEEPSTATVHSRGGHLQTSVEAPFTTREGRQAVLLRRASRPGEFRLYQMVATVRPTNDPNICEIEDDVGELRDGDQLLLVGDEDRADEQIELYRRIAEFIAEVERTPERLEDVRQLLFLTAAMIGAPRCKRAHRAAATRAFEKAREYYDTARRSLARGAAIAASERVHDALRRIGLAAASIAEACAEGQEPLATRVSSEHAPSIEPSEEDAETMRALEAAEKQAGSPTVTASVGHDRLARAITGCPPLAHVREILARANVAVDPAGVRVVGRFGECLADAATRDRARKALVDAGIHASIVRDRLLFPLRQP